MALKHADPLSRIVYGLEWIGYLSIKIVTVKVVTNMSQVTFYLPFLDTSKAVWITLSKRVDHVALRIVDATRCMPNISHVARAGTTIQSTPSHGRRRGLLSRMRSFNTVQSSSPAGSLRSPILCTQHVDDAIDRGRDFSMSQVRLWSRPGGILSRIAESTSASLHGHHSQQDGLRNSRSNARRQGAWPSKRCHETRLLWMYPSGHPACISKLDDGCAEKCNVFSVARLKGVALTMTQARQATCQTACTNDTCRLLAKLTDDRGSHVSTCPERCEHFSLNNSVYQNPKALQHKESMVHISRGVSISGICHAIGNSFQFAPSRYRHQALQQAGLGLFDCRRRGFAPGLNYCPRYTSQFLGFMQHNPRREHPSQCAQQHCKI